MRQIIINASAGVQRLNVYDESYTLLQTFPISTGLRGIGFRSGSNQTPVGQHQISDKIGEGAPLGTVFSGNPLRAMRIETNLSSNSVALMTSRVFKLIGLDRCNITSASRGIYIHGTSMENNIGRRDSHGCIRMRNLDIISLFSEIEVGTPVYIESNDCRSIDNHCNCSP